jgi:hypothetical protein
MPLKKRICALVLGVAILDLYLALRFIALCFILAKLDPIPWLTPIGFKLYVQGYVHQAVAFSPWYFAPVLIWIACTLPNASRLFEGTGRNDCVGGESTLLRGRSPARTT